VIIVDIAFATAEVDPAEQLAAWRDPVNRVFLPLAITPLPGAGRPVSSAARSPAVTGAGSGAAVELNFVVDDESGG
jgi:hypothetical protein